MQWAQVALDVPLNGLFDYAIPPEMEVLVGQRVRVMFGRTEKIALVIKIQNSTQLDPKLIKPILEVLDDLPAMPTDWLEFANFAGHYYQRPLGEVVIPAFPTPLRRPSSYTGRNSAGGPVIRYEKKQNKKKINTKGSVTKPVQEAIKSKATKTALQLNEQQQEAVQKVLATTAFKTFLLHGVTGSGKTEIYLRLIEKNLKPSQQTLLLVPEINLTPQFEQIIRERFDFLDLEQIILMHSGLSDGQRVASWVNIQKGRAQIILGTRLAIFAPFVNLSLILIDEEHDTSYKQQDGLRYSARDLAIWRARQLDCPIVLGSATPSFESWRHKQNQQYEYLTLPHRAVASQYQPNFELIDIRKEKLIEGFSKNMLDQIQQFLNRKQQVLVFINRRGYAPILHCASCGWNSQCRRCSVHTVLHKQKNGPYQLQCHHCGYQQAIPKACPECGNQDLQPLGRGTQKVEEFLSHYFNQARVQRIDADTTSRKGQAEELFKKVHSGEIDILVGTQMVSKGHDFKKLNLVCVLNADNGLYSHDFRASERLFAQLMQVAGRAGRHLPGGRVLIQTVEPLHPLYEALVKQDFNTFADQGLLERQWAQLPPYSYQVLITAQAKKIETALQFLATIKNSFEQSNWAHYHAYIQIFDPIPLRIIRVNNIERAQLLIESKRRSVLQNFLPLWLQQEVEQIAKQNRIKYIVEVDPLEI